MNRQLRRHPTHPFLQIQNPSHERILDKEKPKTSAAKRGTYKKKKNA